MVNQGYFIEKDAFYMKVTFIVAMDKNQVIGKENDIPWRIPRDWEYVKETTNGYPIIIGRKKL